MEAIRPDRDLHSVPRATRVAIATLLVGIHSGLLAWSGYRNSWTWDEVAHLPAGISHWKFANFELFDVNPPLIRMVAAIPVLSANPKLDWSAYTENATVRPERPIGETFLLNNGERSFWMLTLARLACIPFSLIGMGMCYHWSRMLYGDRAGLLALALWTFSPTILAHGALITPDVGAAAVGIVAHYCFWRWLKEPVWHRALLLAVVFGLLQLTKATWVILFAAWPLVWLLWRLSERSFSWRRAMRESLQVATVFVISLLIINFGYAFEGTGRKLGDFDFISTAIGGPVPQGGEGNGQIAYSREYFLGTVRNRFRGTSLGSLPVPLPANYVQGIDRQKFHFERENWSYLRGVWRNQGWWYYYLYAAAIKVPLGTWIIALLAVGAAALSGKYRAAWRDELFLFGMLVLLFAFVSAQTSLNRHFRYTLNSLPFALILISRIANSVTYRHVSAAVVMVGSLGWMIVSSLSTFPHHLSYFNELVGGPHEGLHHLTSSNTDWGQDLLFLRDWVKQNPTAQPLGLAWHVRVVDPRIAGIETREVPAVPDEGWYALSVNRLHDRSQDYRYFLDLEPVATAGYSIRIYHVTRDQANRLRRRQGYPPLGSENLVQERQAVAQRWENSVVCCASDCEQTTLLGGCKDGSVIQMDPQDLARVAASLKLSEYAVRSLDVSPDRQTGLAGCSNGEVWLFPVRALQNTTSEPRHGAAAVQLRIPTSGAEVNRVAFAPRQDAPGCPAGSLLLIGDDAGLVEFRETRPPHALVRRLELRLPVLSLAVSPIAPVFATGTGDWRKSVNGDTRLWSLVDGRLVRTLEGSASQSKVLRFTPDGKGLVARSTNGNLKIWDVDSGTSIVELSHSSGASSVQYSAAGTMLVAVDNTGSIKLWDAHTHQLLATRKAHDDLVYEAAFVDDSTGLITIGRDRMRKLWQLSSPTEAVVSNE